MFESEEVSTQIIDLQIIKTTCPYALVGQEICYTITITNNGDIDAFGVVFKDVLADNMTYVMGSFEVDGIFYTPAIAENVIQYRIDIYAGIPITIKFCVKVLVKTT